MAGQLTRAEQAALDRARRRVRAATATAPSRATTARSRPAARPRTTAAPRTRRPGRRRRSDTLDAYRGVAVSLAVVVLVAGDRIPAALARAPWHGFGPADMVAPALLVAAGVALSYQRAARRGRSGGADAWRVTRRVAVLVALGLALAWLDVPEPSLLRWTGPLQRFAIAYVLAFLVTAWTSRRWQIALAVGALAGQWALLRSGATLTAQGNAAAHLDALVFGPEHVAAPTDPHGLMTVPTVLVTILIGVWLGDAFRQRKAGWATAAATIVSGLYLGVAGVGAAQVIPVNRTLWTPSFVLLSAGMALVLFGCVHIVTEVLPGRRVLAPVLASGRNPLVVTTGTAALVAGADVLLAGFTDATAAAVGTEAGALVVAALVLAAAWVVARMLDARGWYLRA